MSDIDILLATYNGDQYLEPQLISIINQTYTNWKLIIHDDGSSDRTREIITKFQKSDHRIIFLEDSVTNLGASGNFLHLLQHSKAPKIMFCDQDDIWLPNKVELMARELSRISGPAMVYCNGFLLKGKEVSRERVELYYRQNLENGLFLNGGIHGCLMMFNRELKDSITPYPPFVQMHDHLLTLGALALGCLQFIDEVLVYYRQHESNVTGQYETNLLRRIYRFLFLSKSVIDRNHYMAVKAFYSQHKENLGSRHQKLFQEYLNFALSERLPERLKIVYRNKFGINNSRVVLLLKSLLRPRIN